MTNHPLATPQLLPAPRRTREAVKTIEEIAWRDLADCCPEDLDEGLDPPWTFDHDAGLRTKSRLTNGGRSHGATETPTHPIPARGGRPQAEAVP
jgi:hypothetical protein